MPRVLIPLAQGCEELEAVTLIDLLRRADIEVITASLDDQREVIASRGVVLIADTTLDAVQSDNFDMLLLPGGKVGAQNLNEAGRIHDRIHQQLADNRYLAAICAAPSVLAAAGVLDGRQACCYPGFIKPEEYPQITLLEQAVVIDETILTSRGPGTAMDFALVIIETLVNQKTRDNVEKALVRP